MSDIFAIGFKSLILTLCLGLIPFFAIIGIVLLMVYIIYVTKKKEYQKTEYFNQTNIPFFYLRRDIGKLGEYYIYKYLMPLKGYKKYLFNCYIPKSDGTTTEIDVILLHESGVYVFESKNFSGWIFGNEEQKNWTQTVLKGNGRSKKSHFFNPILQNKVHLKWLSEYIAQNEDIPFYSYIVFSDRCKLKNITLKSGEHRVVNRYNLLSDICKNIEVVGNKLSNEKIDYIYNKLYPLTQVDEIQKKEHIDNIQEKYIFDNNKTLEENICPKCGGKLVIRTAKKGANIGKDFLGCSNFPKCRYIKEIDN